MQGICAEVLKYNVAWFLLVFAKNWFGSIFHGRVNLLDWLFQYFPLDHHWYSDDCFCSQISHEQLSKPRLLNRSRSCQTVKGFSVTVCWQSILTSCGSLRLQLSPKHKRQPPCIGRQICVPCMMLCERDIDRESVCCVLDPDLLTFTIIL